MNIVCNSDRKGVQKCNRLSQRFGNPVVANRLVVVRSEEASRGSVSFAYQINYDYSRKRHEKFTRATRKAAPGLRLRLVKGGRSPRAHTRALEPEPLSESQAPTLTPRCCS